MTGIIPELGMPIHRGIRRFPIGERILDILTQAPNAHTSEHLLARLKWQIAEEANSVAKTGAAPNGLPMGKLTASFLASFSRAAGELENKKVVQLIRRPPQDLSELFEFGKHHTSDLYVKSLRSQVLDRATFIWPTLKTLHGFEERRLNRIEQTIWSRAESRHPVNERYDAALQRMVGLSWRIVNIVRQVLADVARNEKIKDVSVAAMCNAFSRLQSALTQSPFDPKNPLPPLSTEAPLSKVLLTLSVTIKKTIYSSRERKELLEAIDEVISLLNSLYPGGRNAMAIRRTISNVLNLAGPLWDKQARLPASQCWELFGKCPKLFPPQLASKLAAEKKWDVDSKIESKLEGFCRPIFGLWCFKNVDVVSLYGSKPIANPTAALFSAPKNRRRLPK